MSRPAVDIDSLSPDERLDLIEDLWDSLAATPEKIPLTAAQRAELDRRLDRLESSEAVQGVTWDEAVDRLRNPNR